MDNQWINAEASRYIEKYASNGIPEDLALRVYTSRLIGMVPQLVMHGGGNTSVKTTLPDFLGQSTEVLCVKGSGWSLETIEPEGLPALRLEPLQAVRHWPKLADEEMVKFQRANLLDPAAPNPSVETLLHAFLPEKFIDHSHATAILSLTNQPDGIDLCRTVFGKRVAIVPYVMPGFDLAKLTADVYAANPGVRALVLEKHGLFTFGDTAKQSYDRHIEIVSLAEDYIAQQPRRPCPKQSLPQSRLTAAELAPLIRGACAIDQGDGRYQRWIVCHRTSESIRNYVDGAGLSGYGQRGVVTPDHIIRTKNKPLIAPLPDANNKQAFITALKQAVSVYIVDYQHYFETHNSKQKIPKILLDPIPRIVLVPGVGLFALGKSEKDAGLAADLFELTIDCVTDAEGIGRYEALPEADLFNMEYWSLEQAKLGKTKALPLQGQIAVITGGAGVIGKATACLFAQNGAEVALLDVDGKAVVAAAKAVSARALPIVCDVTDDDAVAAAIAQVCVQFGGLDILVSNAGATWQGAIGEIAESDLRASFELNFYAHQRLAQACVAVLRAQDTGGNLLFNASKQAINPGPNFGAYGLPKAATLLLSRQYALEYGRWGIRAHAVNADRIRSGLLDDQLVSQRAEARGLSEADYMAGNLLGLEVKAEDVAQAFLHQALALKSTAGVMTVDGGNIAAALR